MSKPTSSPHAPACDSPDSTTRFVGTAQRIAPPTSSCRDMSVSVVRDEAGRRGGEGTCEVIEDSVGDGVLREGLHRRHLPLAPRHR
eukprot:2285655-Rhodomonas_salina.2